MSNCKESVKPLPVVCVVYDIKGSVYTSPMIFQSEETAIRWFDNLADKDPSVVDYNLYLIGHFSDTLGQIFPLHENAQYLLKSGNEYKSRLDIIERLKQEASYWRDLANKSSNEEVINNE